MWLMSLSKTDMKMLKENDLLYDSRDHNLAFRYQAVVNLCVEKDIHAGCDWSKLKNAQLKIKSRYVPRPPSPPPPKKPRKPRAKKAK